MAKWRKQGSLDIYKKEPDNSGWIVGAIIIFIALVIIF